MTANRNVRDLRRAPLQLELVGQRRGEDRVGELLLLAAGLAAGVGVVLVFGVVLAVPLGGGEDEPVPHVGDAPGPLPVRLGLPLAAPEPLDDPVDLQELLLGVLVGASRGHRVVGAGPQVGAEVADLDVRGRLRLQPDVAAGL